MKDLTNLKLYKVFFWKLIPWLSRIRKDYVSMSPFTNRLKTYALSGGAIRISVEDWPSSCSAPFPGLESPFSGCGAGGKGRSLRRRSDIFTNFLCFSWFSWINYGYGIKIPEWKSWIISLKLVTFTIFFSFTVCISLSTSFIWGFRVTPWGVS